MNISIRKLTENDLNEYFHLRLEALKISPTNYLSSYEEEQKTGHQFYQDILQSHTSNNVIFGAYNNNKLIGVLGIYQETRIKTKHKCILWGFYVQPAFRNLGAGKILLTNAIDYVKTHLDCTAIHLTVEASNIIAKKIYESFGFTVWGVEPKAILVNGKYYNDCHMILLLD